MNSARDLQTHVIFAMPKELLERRRQDKASFYCPNGHSMVFQKSDADRLRERLAQVEEDRDRYRERLATAEASRRAYKGQVTQLKKRAIAGVCAFCHRHFTNVERHVESKHKGEAVAVEVMPDPA